MLKRFFSYYKPHKFMFTCDMAASLLISLTGMIYPIITRKMLREYIPDRQYKLIVISGLVVFGLYVLRMFLRYFVNYYGHMIGAKMQAQMRLDLFNRLEELPFSFYDEHETGRIMSRMTNDLFEVVELAHHGPENIITCTVMIVLAFTYLCTMSVPLTLIIFACVPLLMIVTSICRKEQRRAFDARRKSLAVINGALESSLTGIRVTKAFNNREKEVEKFEIGNHEFVESSRMAYSALGKFHASSNFITDIFNVIVLIAGGLFLYNGKIDFADYSTFIVSVNLFIGPINTLIGFVEQYQNGVSGFKRFVEIMDMEPEKDKEGAKVLENVKGDIEFKNVTFSYKKRDGEDDNEETDKKGALNNVSLKINCGEKVALVGESGGGKTTMCHLIPNFYKLPEANGSITIDGQDIRGLTLASLRDNIGIVQQDVFLFSGTIRDNIRYGKIDATEEEIIEAAKKANIHDYVMTLEHGYDTEIGERGVKLSGGQKQRLSIARVFLKNPAILILDEATSALDNATEILIQKALDELCVGRTTIVVAHRLSTIRNANRIAVVSKGEIIELGTHEELMEKGGLYKELYQASVRV
ncbi:MAG: ABC transporter ATP-binding protein/permease [Lachnospiraceae bacterium]|nr:ABC transporter ATP-binding protein/permease [Lachnospiraceae bacterium]